MAPLPSFLSFLSFFGGPAPEAEGLAHRAADRLPVRGRARWTPRDYAALAREGYHAQRRSCIARCSWSPRTRPRVPLLVYEGAARASTRIRCSPCWRGRTRARTAPRFLEALYGHLLVAGNAYVEAVTLDGALRELYALRPDRMKVVPGAGRLAGGLRLQRSAGRTRALRPGRRGRCRRSCI